MNDHKLSYYDLEAVISELLDSGALTTEEALEDEFREILRETPIELSIAGVNFTLDPADYLEENDPTAFRTGFNDWLDSHNYEEVMLNGNHYYTDDIYSVEEAIDAKIDELEDEPEEEEDEDED